MIKFKIDFLSHNRKATCAPDPAYPQGMDVDMARGAKSACLAMLPYPAACCGVWMVECQICGLRAALTAAGRPDDPRSVKLACKQGAKDR
jgi:hypothetical protein